MSLLFHASDESPARTRIAPAIAAAPAAVRRIAGRLMGRSAGFGEAGPAEPAQPARPRRPNLCEFDYDYYVELQRRRTRRPDRYDRVQALPFSHEASEDGQKTARPDNEGMYY